MMQGYTDKPVENITNDTFGISSYINGLCKFILACDTPMTISVQGDWGSGKTSMMNMVKEQIDDKVHSIWFNTWQFSQFNLSDGLAVCMLSNLLKELSYDKEKVDSTVGNLFRGVAKLAVMRAAEGALGGVVTGELISKLNNSSVDDVSETIKNLKEEYQKAVNAKIQSSDKKRVVVFVDDLDRLQPEKAVELLEILKIFLDCENCVYVLAVDYEVVSQGIRKKFGDSVGTRKGRSFFDKIIQLPFQMPVEQYDINKYVGDILKKIKIEHSDDDLNIYINLIKYSIGCNPRSMKRLFNAFMLLHDIVIEPANKISSEKKDDIYIIRSLFSVLCLQMAQEEFYRFILASKDFLDADVLKGLSEYARIAAHDDYADLREMVADDSELRKATYFMKEFIKGISATNTTDLSDDDIARLENLLFFTSMTAVTERIESMPKRQWNGEYYVSFGTGIDGRSWQDALEYGFISADGGERYTKGLEQLNIGDRIWVNIPQKGYAGTGRVCEKGMPAKESIFCVNGQTINFFELPGLIGKYNKSGNRYEGEFIVKVEWEKTVDEKDAFKEPGLFGNQHTICKPTVEKWDQTIARLKTIWDYNT